MISNNFIFYSGKIFAELVRDIIYFPLWWYTRGLVNTVSWLMKFVANREKSLGFLVWVKNIFRPMYGQTDWQGKLISFFIRLVQIIARGIIMIFWILVALILLIIWLALPPLVFIEIIYQVIPTLHE